jgi:hypothetical protein
VLIGQPVQMCEEGANERVYERGGFGDGGGEPTGRVWECFAVSEADNVNRQFILNTDNFYDDRVTVGRANMVCEGAYKFRYPGLPPVCPVDFAGVVDGICEFYPGPTGP